jgi:poly-beta-1,6-N-acetyl-D-glucosamine synthase
MASTDSPRALPSYVIVSPVRDEEEFLSVTIASVCAQRHRPSVWVLVNDGSSDRTAQLINEAAARHPWIRSVHRANRGIRQAGTGVVDAFYAGYRQLTRTDHDYIVKLDGDLSFGPMYFEQCLSRMAANPSLGIVGGTCCVLDAGSLVPEFPRDPGFHVRGPTKIYRRTCFEQIKGLVAAPGWDTIDQMSANMLGWKTGTFRDILLRHHRPTGAAYGAWKDSAKCGLANYVAGYHPAFMVCKCLLRMLRRPFGGGVQDGLGHLAGFAKGYVLRVPRSADERLVSYVRNEQWRALTFRRSLWR